MGGFGVNQVFYVGYVGGAGVGKTVLIKEIINNVYMSLKSNAVFVGGDEDEEKHLDDKLVEELSYIENVECVIPQLSMYVHLKSGKYEGWVN